MFPISSKLEPLRYVGASASSFSIPWTQVLLVILEIHAQASKSKHIDLKIAWVSKAGVGPLLYISSSLPTSSFIIPHPLSHHITYTVFSFSNIPFPHFIWIFSFLSFKSRSSVASSGESPLVPLCTFLKLEKLLWLFGLCVLAQLCPTLCNSMNCSPPGSFVHGIFQTRILEWVAISYSWILLWIEGCSLGSSNHALSHRPNRQINFFWVFTEHWFTKACFGIFSEMPLPWALYFL